VQTKIIDNKLNGKVIEELRDNLRKGSKLSIISAYFTIYAFEELKKELSKVDELKFIFTEPSYNKQSDELIRQYYISRKINNNTLFSNEFEIKLRNELKQSSIAKECAEWLKNNAEIKSLKFPTCSILSFLSSKNFLISIRLSYLLN